MIDNLIFAPAYLYISTVKLQDRKMYERAVWLETPLELSREVGEVFVFIDLA